MSVIRPLLVLQEVDERIRVLQKEAHDIPERKAQEEQRLVAGRSLLESEQAELRNAQLQVNEVELEAKSRREKILSMKKNQAMIKTNKEYQVFNLEIARLEGEIDNFEARQIVAMDALEPIRRQVREAEEALKKEQELVNQFVTELNQRLAGVEAELQKIEQERVEAVKGVDAQSLQYYERLKTKRWPVVVKLQEVEGVCGGCHLLQPPSVEQMVRRNQGLVPCQMCGRILYYQ